MLRARPHASGHRVSASSTPPIGSVAAVLLLAVSLVLSGIATDRARAGARYRAEMLQLVNESRQDDDRRALRLDKGLSRYATKHSREMADAGRLFHTANLGAKLQGRNWSTAGENIGFGSSLRRVMRAFMRSRPHRRNILRRAYDHAGIGVVKDDGVLWVTIIFYG